MSGNNFPVFLVTSLLCYFPPLLDRALGDNPMHSVIEVPIKTSLYQGLNCLSCFLPVIKTFGHYTPHHNFKLIFMQGRGRSLVLIFKSSSSSLSPTYWKWCLFYTLEAWICFWVTFCWFGYLFLCQDHASFVTKVTQCVLKIWLSCSSSVTLSL